MQWTQSPLFCYPTGTDGTALTPSGSVWVSGSYAEVIAATPEAWVLAGVTVERVAGLSFNGEMEVDVAIGGSGSEVIVATLQVSDIYNTAGTGRDPAVNGGRQVLPFPLDAIPSGERVSARVRTNDTNTHTIYLVLDYYKKPVAGPFVKTTARLKVLPSGVVGVTVTATASPNVYGAWTAIGTLVLPALLTHFTLAQSLLGDGDIQIGIGAPGDEDVLTAYPMRFFDYFGIGNRGYFAVPIELPAGDISARVRSASGSGSSARVSIGYLQ